MKYFLRWLFISSLAIGVNCGKRESILTSRKIVDVASQCGIKHGKSHYIDSIVTYCDEPYIGLEAISRKNYDQKPLLCNAAYEVLFILCIQNPEKKLPYDIHTLDKYHEKNIYLTKFCDLFPKPENSKFAIENTRYVKVIMNVLHDKKMCEKTCSKLDGNLIPICVFLLFETPRQAATQSQTYLTTSNNTEIHINEIHEDLLKTHFKPLKDIVEHINADQVDSYSIPVKPYLLEDEKRAHEIYLKKYLASLADVKKPQYILKNKLEEIVMQKENNGLDCMSQNNCKGKTEKLIHYEKEKDSMRRFIGFGKMLHSTHHPTLAILGAGGLIGVLAFFTRKKLFHIFCCDNGANNDKRR